MHAMMRAVSGKSDSLSPLSRFNYFQNDAYIINYIII